MDGGAWWAAVHGVAESRTQLRNFTFTFHFHALEKEMATHSIVLAWRIPRMREPDRLPSMGSHRVGHDWSDLTAAAAGIRGEQKSPGGVGRKAKLLAAQLCLTLCDPIDCSPPARPLCPWNFPGKNTGVGGHSLLQGIFLTQGSNPGLLHCRQILYFWAPGKPR